MIVRPLPTFRIGCDLMGKYFAAGFIPVIFQTAALLAANARPNHMVCLGSWDSALAALLQLELF